MASLSLRNICKKYENSFEAVKDFSLDINDKEFIIFVGPSGCGKSTTLRMIAGLEEITSGELYIDGKLMNDVGPKDRDIAMVFQNYALYPHMSVFDNIAFGLKFRKFSKEEIKCKVEDAARVLDLDTLLDRKPAALSGGQRQRVAIGRAIVRNPKVFLMDEPLSNLDAKLRVQMRTEISKLHQRLSGTIIYVTHDQTEAMTLGTRIVVMKDGIIQQVNTPKNLYDHPKNIFVAGFIGSPQMNFVMCEVIEKFDGIYLAFDNNMLHLDPQRAKALKDNDYIGKRVMMGIRPENLHDVDYSLKKYKDKIKAKIQVYELVGAEVYLYFECNHTNMTARVNPNTKARVGDEIDLYIDSNSIHLFDIETELAIF
ncbi:MAG: sn-glycerol-3-phosphate ABC transporter ATP-binding protein UgpC [Erysipelotrichaceae bacterium]|uniref:ABC transporter ATP-binding protein n=1 Tax=Anaerorhabdus sp. TaxID=1872524 RepID=UPI002FCAD67D